MLQACWNEQDITPSGTLPENIRHLAIFCDLLPQDDVEAAIANRLRGARCLFLHRRFTRHRRPLSILRGPYPDTDQEPHRHTADDRAVPP